MARSPHTRPIGTQPALKASANPIPQLRDIFRGHVHLAVMALSDKEKEDRLRIHASRKQLRRARATLRLCRDALSREQYAQTNRALRNAARPLSAARDADVLMETLAEIGKQRDKVRPSRSACATLHRLFDKQRDSQQRRATGAPSMARIRKALRQVDRAAVRWPLPAHGWPIVLEGVGRTYRRTRRAYRQARLDPSTEKLHEWRKQLKYLWHQLQILTPLSPDPLAKLAARTHKLSDCLGKDHDLSVLGQRINAATGISKTSVAQFTSMIKRRRKDLQALAFAAGKRLHVRKPARFVASVRRYVPEG